VFLSVFLISIIAFSFIAYAEEAAVAGTNPVVINGNPQPPLPQEKNDTQWAWGEVTNLDIQAKTVTIKYLDYEADQEKELVLVIDDKTTFENIKGLEEIKIKDTLSVDYVIVPDNKNIAKNINLEKPETLTSTSAQTANEEVKSPEAAPIEETTSSAAVNPVASSDETSSVAPKPASLTAPVTTNQAK
jgi:hypothetical protein